MTKSKDLVNCDQKDMHCIKDNEFISNIMVECAVACSDCTAENVDSQKVLKQSREGLSALTTLEGLQTMLASQMLAVHKLQQTSISIANRVKDFGRQQYYTNTAIKLSNTFVQQASILAKLQGVGNQKIIVERVNVHDGGQAIVGNIQEYLPIKKDEK